jgi:hypothetical protein
VKLPISSLEKKLRRRREDEVGVEGLQKEKEDTLSVWRKGFMNK